MADNEYYQSGYTGEQIDNAIGRIVNKELDALAAQAAESAKKAEEAANAAEQAAAGIDTDLEAAQAAAQAAEDARAAAVSAQQAAEQAAALAAEQAAADVKDELQGYVDDAEQAKNDAQTAANNAATEAAQGVEDKLAGYVSDAENAKNDAQSAAGTAADDAVSQVDTKMAQYLADAQAAQAAAEKARDEAQAIAGGDFLPTAGGTMTGALTLAGDPTGDLQAVPKRYSDNVFNKIISRGEQLVINGNAALGNNTNFPKAKYDGSQANFSGGSFTSAARSANVTFETEQYVLLDPFKTYRVEFDAKSDEGVNKFLAYLDYYDIDKKRIENKHVRYYTNTLTELAQDLNDGDTVVHLKSLDVWYLGQAAGARGFTFWNYTNSFGYTYPANTYSRNVFSNLYTDDGIDNIAKTITLTNPWSGGTIPAGTKLSQPRSGGNPHWYFKAETVAPTEWTKYDGEFTGVDYSGNMLGRMFSPGTAFVKIGIWVNYQSNGTDNVWVTNISLQSIEDKSVDPANLTEPVPIEKGGTDANNAADALANLSALPKENPVSSGVFTHDGSGAGGNQEVVLRIRSNNGMLEGYGDVSSAFHFKGVPLYFDTLVFFGNGFSFPTPGGTLTGNFTQLKGFSNSEFRAGTTNYVETGCNYGAYPTAERQNFIVKNIDPSGGTGDNWSYQAFNQASDGTWERVFGVKADGTIVSKGEELDPTAFLKLAGGYMDGSITPNSDTLNLGELGKAWYQMYAKIVYFFDASAQNSQYAFGMYQWGDNYTFVVRNAETNAFAGDLWQISGATGITNFTHKPTVDGVSLVTVDDMNTAIANAIGTALEASY